MMVLQSLFLGYSLETSATLVVAARYRMMRANESHKNGLDFLEVSAKTNKNVEESFHTLLSSIYEKEGWNSVDTTTLSPAGSCSVVLQLIAFCNLIFGALQIVGGLSKLVREYPPDQHITNNGFHIYG